MYPQLCSITTNSPLYLDFHSQLLSIESTDSVHLSRSIVRSSILCGSLNATLSKLENVNSDGKVNLVCCVVETLTAFNNVEANTCSFASLIVNGSITLRNCSILGNLTLNVASNVNPTIHLEKCTIEGNIIIRGNVSGNLRLTLIDAHYSSLKFEGIKRQTCEREDPRAIDLELP